VFQPANALLAKDPDTNWCPNLSDFKALRPILPILIGACVMLSIANGLRHSMGMFMQPLTQDLGIAISDFTLAIAVQNLLWGFAQPVAGAWAVRYGFRPMMITGAVLYVAGLIFLATAHGMVEVMIGAGITIGIAMACVGSSIAHAVAARGVPVAMRSTILGVVSATGSLGSLFAAPLGQLMTQAWGWRVGVLGFAALALVLLPAAWYSGKADRIPLASNMATDRGNAFQALAVAFRNPMFVVLAVAFFVCGMQLVFLTTHLPSYLQICGMDPMLSAQALGMIGGFNVLGSLFFGWAGGRYNKLMMLGGIYIVRSLALGWYFLAAPTQTSTLVFAAIMGFLWLGVVPLVSGWIAQTFGLRWLAMLAGVAFVGHQFGSFVGAYGGGVIFDLFGSYTYAWQGGVAIGLAAGIVQGGFAWQQGRQRPPLVPA